MKFNIERGETNAITYKDADLQYVLAYAVKVCIQEKNVIYLNELKRIARSCDCDPFAGPIICPDIGRVAYTSSQYRKPSRTTQFG